MRYLDYICAHAQRDPNHTAIRTSSGESMTYAELWQASEGIAEHLSALGLSAAAPVVVRGHKSPYMVASFLACMKSGHPYVPVDIHSVPAARVASIAEQVGGELLLSVEGDTAEVQSSFAQVIDAEEICAAAVSGSVSKRESWICGEDLAYVLFTSGSTGAPKGVEVTAACFDNFCDWDLVLGGTDKEGCVFLDQAPFSFDLSVFELAGALAAGGSLFSLTHEASQGAVGLLRALTKSSVNIWVSTPSFADMCLANPEFSSELLPVLTTFIFCGETLANKTARRLRERFANATIINTYGPTESTVAVTEVVVSDEMAASAEPLPVGSPRPGTRLRIVDDEGRDVPAGAWGEVVIEGDTVAAGYWGRRDLTERAFGAAEVNGIPVRSYRTGDEGRLDGRGMLHYRGRLDLQIKLNGFRIELGEIEAAFQRLPEVASCAVVAAKREGRISHLVAYVVSAQGRTLSDFRAGLALKEQVKQTLPHYMVPRRVVFVSALPVTGNGKLDRRALASLQNG